MKDKRFITITIVLIMVVVLVVCSNNIISDDKAMYSEQSAGEIYLYGEVHSVEKILENELVIWGEYYHDKNMRHLFIELPYYTGEFLNQWMQSDNDEILDEIFKGAKGTQAANPCVKDFYKKIKDKYPKTIFHGTDVGHQYYTTGQEFLNYLIKNNLEDRDEYLLTKEAIEQGEHYYNDYNDVYRENKMVENFIREFDKLNGESIMGIYGASHTDLDGVDFMTKSVPCMANQLKEHYSNIYSEDLSWLEKDIEPLEINTIMVKDKEYKASYFGKQDITGFKDFSYFEFWRLENAYEDFKDNERTGDVLPCDNYPMLIEVEQVFVIDYTYTDGSVERGYYRYGGFIWNDSPATEEFTID